VLSSRSQQLKMKATLLSGLITLGVFDAKIIDESMGVIGGLLQPTEEYYKGYQRIFRNHLQKPDFEKIGKLQLRTVLPWEVEVKPLGGIVVTDLEEYANEITVEVCGIQKEIVRRIKNS